MSSMLRLQAPRRTPLLCLAAAAALVVVLLPAAPVLAEDAVLHVTEDTTLTRDTEVPIVILADGVTLDCAGNTVERPLEGDYWTGISLVDVSRVTVKNCNVEGFNDGFGVFDSSRITLVDNTVVNGESGFGVAFLFEGVTDSTIRGNVANPRAVYASEGNAVGFQFVDSSGNTVKENSAFAFSEIGFDLSNSSDNTLKKNEAVGPSGYDVATGYSVRGSRNTLRKNTASGFFYGIRVDGRDNTIARNVATGDNSSGSVGIWIGSVGIVIDGSSADASGNMVMSNTTSSYGYAGFLVVNASDNTLEDNVAFDNPNGDGFQLWTATGNTLSRNHSYRNGNGFLLHFNADGNTLSRNVAYANDHGFGALEAAGNTFERNVSTGNVVYGFNMGGTTADNILDRNSADLNAVGFWDGSVDGGTVGTANDYVSNTCTDNTVDPSYPVGLCSG